jgi:acyl-homoserine-lactone acylase
MPSLRLGAAAAALSLAVLATLLVPIATPGGPDTARAATKPMQATIHRTSFGIPHIVADNWRSLGFGQGYATAETSVCELADILMTVRGERSRYLGPDARYNDQVTLDATNLESDVLFTNIRDRGIVRELLKDRERGPQRQVRALVRGYIAGVNQYLADIGGAAKIKDPTCRGAAWVRPGTAMDMWHGIYAANLLASAGVFVPQIVNAAPPSPENPNPNLPIGSFAPVPAQLPSSEELESGLGKGSTPFGSNGWALGSRTTVSRKGMVLGNPHFPWRGRYRFTQSHLTIPGKYNVAGGSLIGAPVINIGWNNKVAWTHTVSTAYRFTPYEYRTVAPGSTTYLTSSGPKALERHEVKVTVKRDNGALEEVVEDVYRTDEGYVLNAPEVLMGWTPASFFALREANAEHLKTVDVFHEMSKARNVRQLRDAHKTTGGMPWVNTMAADHNGDALYADFSVVPNVPDDLVERCATPIGQVLFELAGLPALDGTRADGECAWRDDEDAPRPGVFGPANLPHTIRKDWVVNANDSYWLPNPDQRLEGYARIIGCEDCERSLRTRMAYRHIMDRLDRGKRFGHRSLRNVQHVNRVFAGELARENDDLQKVCEAADGGAACDVLAAWDGRTNTDSVGAHIFREFWLRTPSGSRWEEGFDADRPVETPRDLDESNDDVIQAMRDALDYLEEKGIPLDAKLGDLQVAGDDGAPRIPIGGGIGETGNTNMVYSRNPEQNTDRLYPITYGSSHIQTVTFRKNGPKASTILTYGLATDPTSPFSADQTRLFSRERWVDFPWTRRAITSDPNHTVKVVRQR